MIPTTRDADGRRSALDSGLDWGLIGRQIAGILHLELRRNLFGRRALALYFLAFAPVGLMLLWALSGEPQKLRGSIEAVPVFAGVFEVYLRSSVFLSALILFMSLFRSEILQRSLHYYLLTPARREVLVVGKYLSALLAACLTIAVGTVALYLLTFVPWGVGELGRHLGNVGFSHLISYVGIACLGCAGYGAVFLLLGLFLRNPVVPAVLFWAWEWANFLLPPLLKKVSVIFYLRSLYPLPVAPEWKWAAIAADPISPWLSIPGIFLFIAAVLALAGLRARRMELGYGGD
jgi:ABC-type transport system involved in multi-copper enzyme maturation permease subunit